MSITKIRVGIILTTLAAIVALVAVSAGLFSILAPYYGSIEEVILAIAVLSAVDGYGVMKLADFGSELWSKYGKN